MPIRSRTTRNARKKRKANSWTTAGEEDNMLSTDTRVNTNPRNKQASAHNATTQKVSSHRKGSGLEETPFISRIAKNTRAKGKRASITTPGNNDPFDSDDRILTLPGHPYASTHGSSTQKHSKPRKRPTLQMTPSRSGTSRNIKSKGKGASTRTGRDENDSDGLPPPEENPTQSEEDLIEISARPRRRTTYYLSSDEE